MPMEFIDEHVEPLWLGGKNELSNRQLWCGPCAKPKTAREATQRAKVYRVRERHIGIKKKSCGFRGHRKFDGTIVWKEDK